LKNLLITGGAGFIGSHFVELMLKKDSHDFDRFIILDSLTYSGLRSNVKPFEQNSRIRFIKGDIADRKLVRLIIDEENINSIVNFAAESHVDRSISSSTPFVQSNVMGVANLLEVFRDLCGGKFVQVSTDEVYGSIESGSWDEKEPLAPNSPYSATKAGADLLALSFHKTYGIDLNITRCSNNYGPRQFPEKIIPLFITNLIEDKKLPLYGSGKNVRDWIYVTDHCEAVSLVLTRGIRGEIYNIGGHHEITNRELTAQILRGFGLGEEMIQPVNDRLGHDFRYSVDDSKIRELLGFEAKVQFEEGLSMTIDWYKNNVQWWKVLK
jgi:dTDP-glucose 4,6-dehydratase